MERGELEELQREIGELRLSMRRVEAALFGDEYRLGMMQALYGDKGLVRRVEVLVDAVDRRNWAFRIVLWIGGGVVAVLTAIGQLGNAWFQFWGHK